MDTEDELTHGVPHPSRRAREPTVFTLTGACSILTGHHLTVDIRLHLVQRLVFLLHIGRKDLGIVAPCIIAASGYRLADDHPRVVVTEDAGVFLIAFGIGRDLAHLHVIGGEGRVVEHDAMLTLHAFLH